MLETPYIVVYCLFAIFLVMGIMSLIVYFERIYIARIRRNYINRHRNRFNGLIFIYFCNNIVDIDTETEICTEIDENEYKQNLSDNIIYANGFIDIENSTVTCSEINENEFINLNETEIRNSISV